MATSPSNPPAPKARKLATGPSKIAGPWTQTPTDEDRSPLQIARAKFSPPLPPVFAAAALEARYGVATKAEGSEAAIASLFPHIYGAPNVQLVAKGAPSAGAASPPVGCKAFAPLAATPGAPITIGLVLSGGQAAGGHNVIAGIFDYLARRRPGSTVLGFLGGPSGIVDREYVTLTSELLAHYRNQGGFDIIGSGRTKIESPAQLDAAAETCRALGLSGLVVIGGDDSNTNAAVLAERFLAQGLATRVVGCPKTIDGDLKCAEIEVSFGFDTACKIYAELIGNIMVDARSAAKYWHFVRLMGRAASHITLECALQTHPQVALIGEEVGAQAQTLAQVTAHIADVVCARAAGGAHYGVVLLPEGLIDFVPEVGRLIAELNEILTGPPPAPAAPAAGNGHGHAAAAVVHGAHEATVEATPARWAHHQVAPLLAPASQKLFRALPTDIRTQLLLDRDPHGNVQVAKIETEKLLVHMVEEELGRRKAAGAEWAQKVKFAAVTHFLGYEGRCGLPSEFDTVYCAALGHTAAALVEAGATGVIATVKRLHRPVAEWVAGGTVLPSMMDIERRAGKDKPVIKKALVDLAGAPFSVLAERRDHWAKHDSYRSPGPIQFAGPGASDVTYTLNLEAAAAEAAAAK